MLVRGDVLAFDSETTGLGQKDKPFGMSVSNGTDTEYLEGKYHNALQIGVLNDTPTLVAQNAKFDMRMLSQWGFNPKGTIVDIEVLARLVRNDHMSYSLASQAARHGLQKYDIVEKYIKDQKLYTKEVSEFGTVTTKKHFDQVPVDIMSTYAKQDAKVTFELYKKYIAELDPRSRDVFTTECALTKVCFDMERTGILINETYTRQAMAYEEGLIREAKSQFALCTGKVYDNSKTALVEVFKEAGEEIPKTDKGNDSLTDDVLESFTSPAAKLVQKIRYHEKRISTYYTSFLEFKDENNIIHADIRQAGTTTGRFSYREPNLQNVPKEEDSTDPFVVRGCFVPRPGNVFVSMDYKQQEYRLMLAYANHKKLIAEVMAGADVHQATADLVGISRKHAKTLNFAILYGAGAAKIAAMLGVSLQEAASLKNQYFNKLLEVEKFIHDVTRIGAARGHIYNWAGRKLCINRRDFAYTLPNHLIQGGGADICKKAMVEAFEFLRDKDAKMVLQIHDAIVFEMPEEQVQHLAPKLKQIMIDVFPPKNGMYMDVDVTVSKKSLAERDMEPWK